MPLLAKTKQSARKALETETRHEAANPVTLPLSGYKGRHVGFAVDGKVATLTLNRPDKKNPLTFDSYAEIVDLFRAAAQDKGVKRSSSPERRQLLLRRRRVRDHRAADQDETVELLDFTRMTGEVVKSMRACPQPIIAAIDGVCAGAGAIIAMASDIRIGTAGGQGAFLFNRVGLGGCDMGACAILPRIVGQGRAAELLFTGRSMGGEEAERMGFFNRLAKSETVLADAQKLAHDLANGPTFGNAMTKRMLEMEWAMSVETAVEAEAVAQALCMETEDFAPRLPRLRRQAEAGVRGQLRWRSTTPSRCRSSTTATAASPTNCRAGPTPSCRRCRMMTWTRPAARASRRWARPGFSRRWCRHRIGGLHPVLDVRTLCLAREILAFRDGLADFAFAMQGLGTGSISLFGSEELKRKYLPPVRDGKAIAAFALSEPEAGSDVAALADDRRSLTVRMFRLDGEKTWISNGGIADHYVVFARTGEAPGARGLSAFVVDADTPGSRSPSASR